MEELKGFWWIPKQKKNKLYGTLKLENEQIILTTEDYKFNKKSFNQNLNYYDIIIGESINGKKITLLDCREFNYNSTFGHGTTKKIFVDKAIVGKQFNKKDYVKFRNFKIHFDLLDEFVWMNGFKQKFRKKGKTILNLTYKFPKEKKIKINNFELIITFSLNGPTMSRVTKEQVATQKIFLQIKSIKNMNLNEIYQIKDALRTLLSFATQKSILEDDFYGIEEKIINKTKIPEEIKIYDRNIVKKGKNYEGIIPDNFLFNFHDFGRKYSLMFKKWFSLHDKIKSIIPSYNALIYSKDTYLEYHFLGLIHSIEGLYRILINKNYMNTKKYEKEIAEKLISAIPQTINKNHKESLKSKIKYGYEYSLRKRLTEMYQDYCNKLGLDFNSVKSDIGKIIDTRNYLVHQDNSLKSKASTGNELLRLTYQLKKIMEFIILKEMGFDKDKLKDLLNRYYQNKLI